MPGVRSFSGVRCPGWLCGDGIGCNKPRRSTMRRAEGFGVGVVRKTVPMLQHPAETELSGAKWDGRVFGKWCEEGQHDGLFAFIAQSYFAREGASAESSLVPI
jgi:hypothetical protein